MLSPAPRFTRVLTARTAFHGRTSNEKLRRPVVKSAELPEGFAASPQPGQLAEDLRHAVPVGLRGGHERIVGAVNAPRSVVDWEDGKVEAAPAGVLENVEDLVHVVPAQAEVYLERHAEASLHQAVDGCENGWKAITPTEEPVDVGPQGIEAHRQLHGPTGTTQGFDHVIAPEGAIGGHGEEEAEPVQDGDELRQVGPQQRLAARYLHEPDSGPSKVGEYRTDLRRQELLRIAAPDVAHGTALVAAIGDVEAHQRRRLSSQGRKKADRPGKPDCPADHTWPRERGRNVSHLNGARAEEFE